MGLYTYIYIHVRRSRVIGPCAAGISLTVVVSWNYLAHITPGRKEDAVYRNIRNPVPLKNIKDP